MSGSSDRENGKKKLQDEQPSSSNEGLCSCKRPRTPLSDLKVRESSPKLGGISPKLTGTKIFTGSASKGIRSRKSSPHKCQVTSPCGVNSKTNMDKKNNIFKPIRQNSESKMDNEFEQRAFSPMDIGSRTNSPMDYSSRPDTPANVGFHSSLQDNKAVSPSLMGAMSTMPYTISRPKVPTRSNSRIGISLDMVDLWDPESDSDTETPTGDYDRINGIPINPRKTVDFSELRRHRDFPEFNKDELLSRGANDDTHLILGQTSEDCAGLEVKVVKSRRRYSRDKPKVCVTQNMKALLTYPPPSAENGLNLEDSKLKQETTNGAFVKPSPRTLPILIKPKKNSQKFSKSGEREACLDNPNETSPKLSKPRTNERVLNVTYDFNDDTSSSPSSRRVNFNNFVTVKDGEMSTLEMLRSSNNSAQLIKQKYLGKLKANIEPEPHQSKDLSPREEVDSLQLAY